MMEIGINDHLRLMAFWLCFSRWASVMVNFPLLDQVEVPVVAKILFSLVLTYAFFPYTERVMLDNMIYAGEGGFWFLTIFEVLVGLFLGYMVKMIMNIFLSAGGLITQSVGLGAIKYFDPSFVQSVGPFEKLIHMTVMMMVLGGGALLPMFKGVFLSFFSITPASLATMPITPGMFLHFLKNIFLSSLLLGGPLIITNLLVTLVMGIMSRVVPQMNILMVSFVINIGAGLFVFALTSDEFFHVCYKMYSQILGEWFQFIT